MKKIKKVFAWRLLYKACKKNIFFISTNVRICLISRKKLKEFKTCAFVQKY